MESPATQNKVYKTEKKETIAIIHEVKKSPESPETNSVLHAAAEGDENVGGDTEEGEPSHNEPEDNAYVPSSEEI